VILVLKLNFYILILCKSRILRKVFWVRASWFCVFLCTTSV